MIKEAVESHEPIIQFADQLIARAIEQAASDIHIEPLKQAYRIRVRQDGLLHENTVLPISFATRLVMRFKVMAELDIAERRLPQDGSFRWNKINVRASTCPTLFGEKIALRLLYHNARPTDFATLGFNEAQTTIVKNALSKPHGLILLSGPTGSGKTTTLYTMLHFLNSIEKNISTIEDPIEIALEGINQINVNSKCGLDFSNACRTLLRQDPDVLMIGEIRDAETAKIAIQAAQTGHLVLSTVHAKSPQETLDRLTSLDVTAQGMSSISLIITQRLLRKQYSGRIGIYELFSIGDPTYKTLSLHDAGMEKVRLGIATQDELTRVLG